ncbi:MAG: hypothetical protein IJ724_10660, partial [Muribaculaceae bacterium]|nr:hypothetical protein [Muribaculaceae bacterium]
ATPRPVFCRPFRACSFVLTLSPGLRCRYTPACVLPPIQGLFVCFDPVTGVALSLHPGLCSASPSGLLLSSNHALLCIEKREELSNRAARCVCEANRQLGGCCCATTSLAEADGTADVALGVALV